MGEAPHVETLAPSPTGKPRYQVVVEGVTYEGRIGPNGEYLHIRGPLENKKPLRAMYSLRDAEVCQWPGFYGTTKTARTRQRRFNTAAWALIDKATEGELAEIDERFCDADRVMPPLPLRRVTDRRGDDYGSYWDVLECGHEVNATNERPAESRRCARCALKDR